MINFFNTSPLKRLTKNLRRSDGRNSFGRITSYHRGGGAKRRYRLVDFKRYLLDIPAFVRRIEYDPIRNSYIALICYANGILSYIIASENLSTGAMIANTKQYYTDYTNGSSLLIKNFPIGSFIYNLELVPGEGAKICRAAGSYAQILKKIGSHYAIVKLKSGEHRLINCNSFATSGIVSNTNFKNISLHKAGQARLLGRRPIVRGVAMNPIDHPHGGNTSGGRPSVSPWGKLAKGGKTRSNKKNSNNFIVKKRLL
jgi:large subunit ribosomal protein L2